MFLSFLSFAIFLSAIKVIYVTNNVYVAGVNSGQLYCQLWHYVIYWFAQPTVKHNDDKCVC